MSAASWASAWSGLTDLAGSARSSAVFAERLLSHEVAPAPAVTVSAGSIVAWQASQKGPVLPWCSATWCVAAPQDWQVPRARGGLKKQWMLQRASCGRRAKVTSSKPHDAQARTVTGRRDAQSFSRWRSLVGGRCAAPPPDCSSKARRWSPFSSPIWRGVELGLNRWPSRVRRIDPPSFVTRRERGASLTTACGLGTPAVPTCSTRRSTLDSCRSTMSMPTNGSCFRRSMRCARASAVAPILVWSSAGPSAGRTSLHVVAGASPGSRSRLMSGVRYGAL